MKHFMKSIFAIGLLALWSMQLAASALTEKDVQNVIGIMAEMEALGDEVERLVPELAEQQQAREQEMSQKIMQIAMSGEGDPTVVLMQEMDRSMREDLELIRANPEADALVTSTVRKHGFSDSEEWVDTFLQVFRVQMALMSEQARPEMEAMMKEMENMPGMSQEDIARMKAQVQQMQDAQRSYFSNVTEADKRVVRSFSDELNEIMNYEED